MVLGITVVSLATETQGSIPVLNCCVTSLVPPLQLHFTQCVKTMFRRDTYEAGEGAYGSMRTLFAHANHWQAFLGESFSRA